MGRYYNLTVDDVRFCDKSDLTETNPKVIIRNWSSLNERNSHAYIYETQVSLRRGIAGRFDLWFRLMNQVL